MAPLATPMVAPQFSRKALVVLRENVKTLLYARREDQAELARHCGHDKSWINKILNEGRGMQLDDLDKVASFFGIEPYQLFQPGISRLTERRRGGDRRTGLDRRVGHTGRLLTQLRMQLNKSPRHSTPLDRGGDRESPSISDEEAAILAEAERRLADLHHRARQQDATPGGGKPLPPPVGRKVRRSDPRSA